MTKPKRVEPRTSVRCASGVLCFLHRYKHLNKDIVPGVHSTPEDALRCEVAAGITER